MSKYHFFGINGLSQITFEIKKLVTILARSRFFLEDASNYMHVDLKRSMSKFDHRARPREVTWAAK